MQFQTQIHGDSQDEHDQNQTVLFVVVRILQRAQSQGQGGDDEGVQQMVSYQVVGGLRVSEPVWLTATYKKSQAQYSVLFVVTELPI